MSGTIVRANSISQEHTGDLILPINRSRSYFFIVMITAAGTLEFGQGGGEIPLSAGDHYNPHICPTGEIHIRTAGDYVIHMA